MSSASVFASTLVFPSTTANASTTNMRAEISENTHQTGVITLPVCDILNMEGLHILRKMANIGAMDDIKAWCVMNQCNVTFTRIILDMTDKRITNTTNTPMYSQPHKHFIRFLTDHEKEHSQEYNTFKLPITYLNHTLLSMYDICSPIAYLSDCQYYYNGANELYNIPIYLPTEQAMCVRTASSETVLETVDAITEMTKRQLDSKNEESNKPETELPDYLVNPQNPYETNTKTSSSPTNTEDQESDMVEEDDFAKEIRDGTKWEIVAFKKSGVFGSHDIMAISPTHLSKYANAAKIIETSEYHRPLYPKTFEGFAYKHKYLDNVYWVSAHAPVFENMVDAFLNKYGKTFSFLWEKANL